MSKDWCATCQRNNDQKVCDTCTVQHGMEPSAYDSAKTIDDIDFTNAVLSIPTNTVRIRIECDTLEPDGLKTVTADFDPVDVRQVFMLFNDTINGDYPLYTLTEKGKKLFEEELP